MVNRGKGSVHCRGTPIRLERITVGRNVFINMEHSKVVYMLDQFGQNPGIVPASKLVRWVVK